MAGRGNLYAVNNNILYVVRVTPQKSDNTGQGKPSQVHKNDLKYLDRSWQTVLTQFILFLEGYTLVVYKNGNVVGQIALANIADPRSECSKSSLIWVFTICYFLCSYLE